MEKKYIIDNPKLMAEWNYEKNIDIDPSKLTLGSSKKVWWKCKQGHEWQTFIYSRNSGKNCPYCSGQKILRGFNDLTTINPRLSEEWNFQKNGNLKPENFTIGSGKKVWWKCKNGHEWQATISHRNNNQNCPFCSGRYAIKGINDLQTINPTLATEWNYEKNNNLTPMDVLPNSNKNVWWKCNKGHEWKAAIFNRNRGDGCPYCANKKILKEYNDLTTLNPTLAKEWNYDNNGDLKPEDFTDNSNKKVWWKCSKGHEWQATIVGRNRGQGCPVCNSERHTSFPEFAILFYLKKYGLDVIHSYKENGYELDIYIPSKKIGIEYDGSFWHKNKTAKDLEKNAKCKKDGIKLYRIREGLPSLNDSSLDCIVQENQKDLPQALETILSEIIGINVDISLERDNIEIESLREYTEKENSLSSSNPTLAKEWNYEKNSDLKPEHFLANSNKKVWWKCKKGHEWYAPINRRNNGAGCPYCSGRYAVTGETDLQTINPLLANEWNYGKNNELTPTNVMPSSNKKVWWKCDKGHEWQATINSRSNGRGCPYCSGRKKLDSK